MGKPPFLRAIREKVGNDLLVLPTVAGLVTDEVDRILLIRHSRDGNWTLPGGCREPDEYPAERLIIEMREETGLAVRPIKLLGVYGGAGCRVDYPNGDKVRCIVSLFACEVVGGTLRPDGEESLEVRFFSEDELVSLEISTIGRTLLDARHATFQDPRAIETV
jgi:ADP-ribose pyrophosphatase YjhB (NUDIX family)